MSIKHNMKAIVSMDTLKDAVQNFEWKIQNLLEDKYKPRDTYVIVKEALSLVGTKPKYDLLDKNCEHFATELRYGRSESRQAMVGIAVLLAGVAVAMFAIFKK